MSERTLNDDWYRAKMDTFAEITRLRAEDPEYDRAWREGLQAMADRIDVDIVETIYRRIWVDRPSLQRTGDEVL